MPLTYFEELKEELHKGIRQKGHPFRFFVLGTVGLKQIASIRTVVLRDLSKNLSLTFYTDKRSEKIQHIKANNRVSLLFYHPEKLMQITIKGWATRITDESILKAHWNRIPHTNQKDYTTSLAPGSPVQSQDAITYLSDKDHFCMVEIEPYAIELLQLGKFDHKRIQFSRDGEKWKSEFLVP